MPSVTTNDGVKLAYEQSGTSGPAVVLVHGWGASRECEWHAHTTAQHRTPPHTSARHSSATSHPLGTTPCHLCHRPALAAFTLNAGALAERCVVYRYDQRFHGESDKPAWGFSVARLAADLKDFIDTL